MSEGGARFGDLFQGEADALYRFALIRLRHPHEAEDAVQDAFLRLCRRGDDPARFDNPRAWMFRVLVSVCEDRRRADARRSRLFDSGALEPEAHADRGAQSGEAQAEAADALRGAMAGMRRLPRGDAEALALVALEGMSYAEAAEILAVPIGTIRSRVSRARQSLRALMADPSGAAESDGKVVFLKGRKRSEGGV